MCLNSCLPLFIEKAFSKKYCFYVIFLLFAALSLTGCTRFVELDLIADTQHDAPPYRIYKQAGEIRVEREGITIFEQSTEDAVRYTFFGPNNRYLLVTDTQGTGNSTLYEVYLTNLVDDSPNGLALLRREDPSTSPSSIRFQRSRNDGALLFSYVTVGGTASLGKHERLRVYRSANRTIVCGSQTAGIVPPSSTEGTDLYAEASADEVVLRDEGGNWEYICPLGPGDGEGHLYLPVQEINFGEVRQKEVKTEQLTVRNTGDARLSFQISSSDEEFSIQPNTATLSPGDETMLTVTFSPTISTPTGVIEGHLDFTHNGSANGDRVTLLAQVLPAPAELSVEPAYLDFEEVLPGQVSNPLQARVSNVGGLPLEFSFETSNHLFRATRLGGGNLAPGDDTLIEVDFAPPCGMIAGNVQAELAVTGAGITKRLDLYANVPAARPDINVTTQAVDFGKIYTGHSYSAIIRIENRGNGLLKYRNATSNNPLFSFSWRSGSVPPWTVPQDERVIGVIANPTDDTPLGPVTATVSFDHNDCTQPSVNVPVRAEVAEVPPPSPNISGPPSHITIVGVFPGQSDSKDFVIFNAGSLPLTFDLTSSSPLFSISQTSGSLDPTERQRILVTFSPPEGTAPGSHRGELTITHNDPNKGPLTIILEGVVEYSDWKIIHQTSANEWLLGINTPVVDQVYAVGGETGLILTTNDDGANWQRISEPGWHHLRDIQIIGDTGIAVGAANLLLRSNDGGSNWEEMSGLPSDAGLLAVDLVDDTSGCVVGGEGTILRTDDSGQSWATQNCAGGISILDVDAISTTNAWAVGAQGGLICSTNDGGANWSHSFLNHEWSIHGIHFAHESHGLAVGEAGLILRTDDGGATWQVIPPEKIFVYDGEPTMRLNDVIMLKPYGRAWAVGENGMILFSFNGGREWYQERTGLTHDLNAIDHDGESLWVSGSNPGVILRRRHVPH